jgi:hypothetical protein
MLHLQCSFLALSSNKSSSPFGSCVLLCFVFMVTIAKCLKLDV